MSRTQAGANQERSVRLQNGWVMLVLLLAMLFVDIGLLINTDPPLKLVFILLIPVIAVLFLGFFSLQPNEARVLVLFGAYKGTVRQSGFHWGNPFYSNGPQALAAALSKPAKLDIGPGAPRSLGRNKISLRARTFNGEKLKVNDKRGNPIEIAAVVVWRVEDTAQALFDVDSYEKYVVTQSESALRHLANLYAYDGGEAQESTLRSSVEEVSQALRKELLERLGKAGVVVDEARLTHLAYAPEIAQAMLRRQQAEAVIDARQKIVHGAVSMVDMALKELAEKEVVHLDDERRAAMVSNLMVVLCGESEVHPIVNTGTLYT
jgi:regulator of protease activity HflC (stomatin/prohibitin superfamily)